jgi:hypothetical protein
MSRGLALPVGVNNAGGALLVEKDEQADKIIFTALSDNDNRNAFQQNLGLGGDMIFDIQSPALRAKILRRIINVFRTFEQLEMFKIVVDSVEFKSDPDTGDLNLDFKYINLESDEVNTFRRRLSDLG